MLGNTLAASLIWGINTIFLLDAGLTNFEAFAANAFFTAGMVIFEVPTGIVADTIGPADVLPARHGDADRVDAPLRPALAGRGAVLAVGRRRRSCSGSASPSSPARSRRGSSTRSRRPGSTASSRRSSAAGRSSAAWRCWRLGGGGFIAAAISLGVPFLPRGIVLGRDVRRRLPADARRRLHARKGGRPLAEMRTIWSNSIEYGWRVPAVKWLMLGALFAGGVGIYGFYALQPYLLELYGDPEAYRIAGLVGRHRRGRADPRRDRRARGSGGCSTSAPRPCPGTPGVEHVDARTGRPGRQLLGRDRR